MEIKVCLKILYRIDSDNSSRKNRMLKLFFYGYKGINTRFVLRNRANCSSNENGRCLAIRRDTISLDFYFFSEFSFPELRHSSTPTSLSISSNINATKHGVDKIDRTTRDLSICLRRTTGCVKTSTFFCFVFLRLFGIWKNLLRQK